MSLFIASLNSGSNGNCYYIGNETEAILVDAGICCSEIEKRLKRLGVEIRIIKAVFISHEHSDHIFGVKTLAKKYSIPVYITQPTMWHSQLDLAKQRVIPFRANESISIGNLSVTPFPKFHDAADPYCFVVSCDKTKVGVFTDLGKPCNNVINHFQQCHAAFLESNYDETMLETGRYPYFLKSRIRSDRGHLSNRQALELFTLHRSSHMSHLILSHLSKNNNCPKLVQQLFENNASGVKMIVASRYKETELYHIENTESEMRQQRVVVSQLALW